MRVIKASSRPTKLAPAENFTGTVMQDEVVTGASPSRLRATSVSFTPGARTAWHTEPRRGGRGVPTLCVDRPQPGIGDLQAGHDAHRCPPDGDDNEQPRQHDREEVAHVVVPSRHYTKR